jgi:hypothetical protein
LGWIRKLHRATKSDKNEVKGIDQRSEQKGPKNLHPVEKERYTHWGLVEPAAFLEETVLWLISLPVLLPLI